MKLLYFYSKDNSEMLPSETRVVDDDFDASKIENATLIKPADGLYEPLRFTGTEWVGTTREEWLANQPEPEPVEPSNTDKALAAVTYQQMMTTQDITTLQTQNAQMAYQLMMMQKQGGEA